MFIGLIGTLGSGIEEIADYLINDLHFKYLMVKDHQSSSSSNAFEPFKTFDNINDMNSFATSHWLDDFVMLTNISSTELDKLMKRPFYLLISVDAPTLTRFNNYRRLHNDITLEQFISKSEALKYDNDGDLLKNIERAQLKIINQSKEKQSMLKQLNHLNLKNRERLRPAWDSYFMSLASLAALRSNCMKRRVGCVIVRDNRVIATGYNGTPRKFKNCNEGGCPRCNNGDACGVGLSTCLCLHAEENALLEAGRDRIGSSATVYCNTCPCLTCSIKIVQAGIREVVYSQSYSMDKMTSQVFKKSGVILRQFTAAKSGIVIIK